MKKNRFIVLMLVMALLTFNMTSVFANSDTSTGDSVEVSEDNPERIIDFEIKTTIDGIVNISYVDGNNKSIAKEESHKVKNGTFTYKAIDIPGYVSVGENTKIVTITKDGQKESISFVYRKAVGTVYVSYVAGNNELAPRESFSVAPGTYEYSAKSFDGYNLKSPAKQPATISKDGQSVNVVFNYEAIPVVVPTPNPVIQPTPEPVILKGTVKGYLLTDKGVPIANTRLELHSKPLVAFTDDKGYFEFKDVPLGTHKLYLADDNYSKELIELKSLTVKENQVLKAQFSGDELVSMAKDTGLVETTELSITDNSLEKEIELVVALKVKGTIIVKYMLNGEILDQDELANLEMGVHEVKAKQFDKYVLVSNPDTKEVELTEDTPNQTIVVEFTYEPVPVPIVESTPEPKPLPIIPIAVVATGFIFAFVLIFTRKHIVVYAIDYSNGKETLRRLSKKRVKSSKDVLKVNLQKDILLASGSQIKVVFLKNISRRIGGKNISFYNGNTEIERSVAPVKLNKEFDVIIKAQSTTQKIS